MQDGRSKCKLTALVIQCCHDLGALMATPEEGHLRGSILAGEVSYQLSVLTAWT